MTRLRPKLRRPHIPSVALAVTALGAFAFVASGSANAHDSAARAVPPPPAVPTSADQIQNLGQVESAIKAYYGDTVTTAVDPVPNSIDGGDKILHTFSPTGPYAQEMAGIAHGAERYLRHPHHRGHARSGSNMPAVVFDVDDTTLTTYNYEIYSNWAYNPDTNKAFVNACLPAPDGVGSCVFPAAPSMAQLASDAEAEGYTVFFLTGRPESQRAGTLANLTSEGYDAPSERVFLKDVGGVDTWLTCSPCSTIQYKSQTRQHIESLGYDIVANFGDQYSDLTGGYANKTFKLPNPNYYLP